jgi:hemerythrin-like domain-containing protein
VWRVLEPALLAHLDAEEEYLLPALDEAEQAECEQIRNEHSQIRRTLGELGMALELHTARAEPIVAFCAFLKAHAEREDSLLYSSAERHMPEVVARSLVSRLRAIGIHPKRASAGRAGDRVRSAKVGGR